MFKKIKGLFIEDDGKMKSIPEEQLKSTSKKTMPSEEVVSDDFTYSMPSADEKPNPKFVNVLLKAVEANNVEGFDYLEFKQALQNLSAMDMDDQTKYQSALAMAKTMGATSQNLISSANGYLKVLELEEKKFRSATVNRRETQLTGKQNEIKRHEQSISKKQAQIEKLQAEILAHEQSLKKAQSGINNEKAKVDATVQGFMSAYHMVRAQIENDITNMKNYF